MSRFRVVGFTIALALLMSGNVSAYTIDDSTLVGIGHSRDTEGIIYGTVDFLGSNYDTWGINVDFTGQMMTVDLHTKYGGGGSADSVYLGIADIFFNTGSGYNYAVDIESSGIFADVTRYITSESTLQGNTSRNWAYGRYWGDNIDAPSPIVKHASGFQIGSLADYQKNDAGSYWVHSVVFDYSLLGINPGDEFDIFWATAYCANDIVEGSVNAPVPEPATMLLLGTGLIGLATISRRKLSPK